MSSREPPFIQYEDVPQPRGGCLDAAVLVGGLGIIALVAVWGYIGPVLYTVSYVADFVIHLFNPAWPVKWMGDNSTYTIVVSGLTALAMTYGVYRLIRLSWRIVQFIREG
ncbi:hypothetical protein [Microvirga tunisiensis]|uniref:Uncharacterized protein n=1 Tax=Microvirga tunisiensis TaxID=2108360 RepID=A0A5N7MJF6_9HYPH|nr:hypothetical protein [Microvirga tunisiensis]MPR08850.1 hypothetical protein [Microvirga tunisiensis]MPR27033.1 hypothetical protein [Microvirga tunisiensis]